MSLYWPEGNVARVAINEFESEPFDRTTHPNTTNIPTTCVRFINTDNLDKIARMFSRCLGEPFVEANDKLTKSTSSYAVLSSAHFR